MDYNFERYAKQIILPEIGLLGQQKIKSSKILCVGAGGIGSPVLLYLAASGVGAIGIVDFDKVEITNLQRQVLFTEKDCGKNKAIVAKQRLLELNSTLQVESIVQKVTASNVMHIMQDYDIVIDGTDNFAAKFLLNDCAVKLGKILVHGSVSNFEGRVAVFDADSGACYRCLYPELPVAKIDGCNEAGVIGPMVGFVGMIVAMQALKLALGKDICQKYTIEVLVSKLWLIDGLTMQAMILNIDKNLQCKICGIKKENINLKDENMGCNIHDDVTLLTEEQLLKQSDLQIVDVRDRSEWNSGHLDGAIHIPIDKILDNTNELCMLNKERPVLAYCKHGIRSLKAAKALKAYGFLEVCSLKDGLSIWKGKLIKES